MQGGRVEGCKCERRSIVALTLSPFHPCTLSPYLCSSLHATSPTTFNDRALSLSIVSLTVWCQA